MATSCGSEPPPRHQKERHPMRMPFFLPLSGTKKPHAASLRREKSFLLLKGRLAPRQGRGGVQSPTTGTSRQCRLPIAGCQQKTKDIPRRRVCESFAFQQRHPMRMPFFLPLSGTKKPHAASQRREKRFLMLKGRLAPRQGRGGVQRPLLSRYTTNYCKINYLFILNKRALKFLSFIYISC